MPTLMTAVLACLPVCMFVGQYVATLFIRLAFWSPACQTNHWMVSWIARQSETIDMQQPHADHPTYSFIVQ